MKTEDFVVEAIYDTNRNRNYRVLFITPYENQVRAIFKRINEILNLSPAIKRHVVKNTQNPFQIVFDNDSAMFGFTTGASSGSAGNSVRGQRADTE